MQDPFVGTWRLNPAQSQFDTHHRPRGGTMRMEVDADGHYLLTAEGTNEKGEKCVERPQRLIPDGEEHPLPDFPGLSVVTRRASGVTLTSQCRREDGSIVGEGTYVLSDDGTSMTATTAGFDTQLRRFEMRTVWDRVQAGGR